MHFYKMGKFLTILDEEADLMALMITEGGVVPKHLANKLCGYPEGSMNIYRLKSDRIERWKIDNTYYFSAIDCYKWGKKRAKTRAELDKAGLSTFEPALRP